jgi:anti-sigma-K factor RskA
MPEKKKTPVYLIDTNSPFYRPLGRRVIICLAAIAWAALEGWHREPFWSVISLACAIYCVYVLFWAYKEPADAPAVQPATLEADESATVETVADTANGQKDKG